MINIKIIGGILFTILVWTLIFNAVEPEITGALIKLEGNMICPPELSEENFDICFSSNGEVIVNGNLKKEIILELEENVCKIPIGDYENVNICNFENLWSSQKLYITGMGLFKKTLSTNKIISYAKTGEYIKLLRIVKKLPIK